MRIHLPLLLFFTWLVSACTPPARITYVRMNNLSHVKVTTVMAHGVNPEMEAIGISDAFKLHEFIYAYITFSRWRGDSTKEAQHIMGKWYIQGHCVATSEYHSTFQSEPWNVWFSVDSSRLGVGTGRVEIYSQGLMIDRHAFEILPD